MPPSQLSDQELQFKKRARRRLVGAVALVLLMVTVLPMILDDRASQAPQQDIEITIPSQEGTDFTSKIIPVDPEAADTQVAEVPLVPLQQPVTDTEATAQPEKPLTTSTKTETLPADMAKPADVPVEKASKDGFVVQIGVFSDAANVKKLQDQLQAQGYKSYTEKVATPKGDKIRLRAGPFDSRLEAESALAKIKDAGLSGMVVKNS
ncbi:MAG TPA: SPOR domain-containing protein [Methylophilaceae bacterium]|nr:SPOR domain-containing protein [Methylophilaceae bacterium]